MELNEYRIPKQHALAIFSANILLIINVLFNVKLFVTDTNYW